MKAAEFYMQVIGLMERITVALETPEGQPIPGAGKGATAAAPAEGATSKTEEKEPEAPKVPSFEEALLALREHAQEHGIESATALAVSFGADPKETKTSQIPEEKRADFIVACKAGKFTPPGEAKQTGLFG